MSLGPIYVQADDGQYYQDPVIRGDDFFLCWDEDDPPELVIRADEPNARDSETIKRMAVVRIKKRARRIIDELGISARYFDDVRFSWRCFTETLDVENMTYAGALFLNIKKPVPARHFAHCKIVDLSDSITVGPVLGRWNVGRSV